MQTWVNANPFFTPYTNLNSSLISETGNWKNYIQLEGIQWFAYSFLPKKNITTSLNEKKQPINFSLYPNPTKEFLNIEIETINEYPATVSIKNIFGDILYSDIIENNNIPIFSYNISNLNNCIYFITISINNYQLTKKIIINQ